MNNGNGRVGDDDLSAIPYANSEAAGARGGQANVDAPKPSGSKKSSQRVGDKGSQGGEYQRLAAVDEGEHVKSGQDQQSLKSGKESQNTKKSAKSKGTVEELNDQMMPKRKATERDRRENDPETHADQYSKNEKLAESGKWGGDRVVATNIRFG